ncbi:hypothetical protein JCM10212_004461 [Sporobolomyces blumeae]
MARGKKHPVQQQQQQVAPTRAPTLDPRPRPKRAASPLPFAHYLPRVPLQLAAVFFSLLAASASTVPASTQALAPTTRPVQRVAAALIHDPLRTLPVACALLALVQAWFGIWAKSCRASAKKQAQDGDKSTATEPRREKRSPKEIISAMWNKALSGEAPHKDLWRRATQANVGGRGPTLDTDFIAPALATTFAGAVVFHVCAVLLGAPLLSNVAETAALSVLVSILAILPLAIALPPILSPTSSTDRYVWLRFFSSVSPNDDLELALLAPALGAILGAWLGAIPVPLDWDRPWQVWPTTCVFGTLIGHAVGSIISLAVAGFHTAARAAEEALDAVKSE